jgi:hypothetical protein
MENTVTIPQKIYRVRLWMHWHRANRRVLRLKKAFDAVGWVDHPSEETIKVFRKLNRWRTYSKQILKKAKTL